MTAVLELDLVPIVGRLSVAEAGSDQVAVIAGRDLELASGKYDLLVSGLDPSD
jgi:hypothetical protein